MGTAELISTLLRLDSATSGVSLERRLFGIDGDQQLH